MHKLRVELTDDNINFININKLSVTKILNNLVEFLRIEDASEEKIDEISKLKERIINCSRK